MKLECPSCGTHIEFTDAPRCVSCGWQAETKDGVLVLLTEADKQSEVMRGYFGNYERIADDDLETPVLDLEYVKRQAENMRRHIGDVSGLDVLDLGCGQGLLAKVMSAGGAHRVVAVDISMAYLKRLAGHNGITPVLANAETLPFVDGFDVLASTDVMEHVLNLGSFLVSINRALRMGGRAVIRVPYQEDLIRYSSQAGCKYPFVHLRAFDKPLLKDTLRRAGFEIERFKLDGFNLYSPQPFWSNGTFRDKVYFRIQAWLLSRMSEHTAVAGWHPRLASLLMRPQEIVIIARKCAVSPY